MNNYRDPAALILITIAATKTLLIIYITYL